MPSLDNDGEQSHEREDCRGVSLVRPAEQQKRQTSATQSRALPKGDTHLLHSLPRRALHINTPVDEHDLAVGALQDGNDVRPLLVLGCIRGGDGPALEGCFARRWQRKGERAAGLEGRKRLRCSADERDVALRETRWRGSGSERTAPGRQAHRRTAIT